MLGKFRSILTFGGGFLFGAWIVFMGFFGYLQFSDAQVEYDPALLTQPQALVFDYATWKTYENIPQDYTLQYPATWFAQDFTLFIGTNAVISDTAIPPNARLPESPLEVNRGFILDIFIRKTEGQSDPEKWVHDNLKSFDPQAKLVEMESVEVSGENARLLTLKVESTETLRANMRNTYNVVVLPYKNDTYIFRLFTGAEEAEKYQPVFLQMLQTFQFKDEVVAQPWKKYVNQKFGHNFEHPTGWQKKEEDADTVKVWKEFAADNTTEGLAERAEFAIKVFNFPSGTNLKNWVGKYDPYKNKGLKLIDEDEGPYVNGVRGIKRFYASPDEPGRFVTLFIPYNQKLYRIEYNFVFDPVRVKRKATYERILYDILNTLNLK